MSVAEPPHGPLSHRDATYYQVPRRRLMVVAVLAWLVVFSGGIASAAYIFRDKYLAYALSSLGEEVGVLDGDVYGHSIPHMLGVHQKPIAVDDMMVPPVRGDLKLMSIGHGSWPNRA